jgi:cytochrome c553
LRHFVPHIDGFLMHRFALLLSLVAGPLSADTILHPPSLSALKLSCLGCHGETDAPTQNHIPTLSQLTPAALESKLMAYKENRLQGTVMNRICQGLTQDELHQLSITFKGAP